mgnify:CR=1 FL=1
MIISIDTMRCDATNQGNKTTGKNPKRVEAGKRTAKNRGRASLSEAGRKGGLRSHGGNK